MSDAPLLAPLPECVRLLAARLLRSRNLANIFWAGSGTMFSGALGALCSAIYARALGVEEFGVFTLVLSLVMMLASLCDLGIGGSMVKFGSEALARGDDRRLRLVVGLAARAKLVLTLVVMSAAALFLRPLVSLFGTRLNDRLETYFLYSLLTGFAVAAAAFFPSLYQIFRKFRRQALVAIAGPASKAIILAFFLLAAAKLTVGRALLVEGAVAFTGLALFWGFAPLRAVGTGGSDPGLRASMLSFNKWLSLYFIISAVGGRIDISMMAGMGGSRDLGLYGAALKVAGVVLVAANAYLSVLLPDFAGVLSAEDLRRKRRHALLLSAAFCAGLALIALAASPMVRIIFGESFAEVAPLVRVMLIGAAGLLLGYPVLGTLYVLNKSVIYPLMAGAAAVVVAALCWLLIPRLGGMGAAVAFACGNVSSSAVAVVYYVLRGRHLEARHDWAASAQKEAKP